MTFTLLTYRVKTCVSAYTDRNDHKGCGGLFSLKTFHLLPVGIFCQLLANFRVGSFLPQALRVLALRSLFSPLAMVKGRVQDELVRYGLEGVASVLTQDDLGML